MNKRYKLIIIVESIILFFAIAFIGYNMFINELLNDKSKHLRAEYEGVKIYEIGNPIFFGPNTVKVSYGSYSFETNINNDGAGLTNENFNIIKNNDFYEITLKGCEQKDITYYLKVNE